MTQYQALLNVLSIGAAVALYKAMHSVHCFAIFYATLVVVGAGVYIGGMLDQRIRDRRKHKRGA